MKKNFLLYLLTIYSIKVLPSASVSFKRLCIFRPKGAIQIRYYYYVNKINIKNINIWRTNVLN